LKQVFIFFPFWLLAHRQLTLKNKMVLFVIPVTMFLGSFAPYWQEGHTGIIGNTFLYNPDTNAPLYNLFIGRWVIDLMNALLPRAFKRMFFVLMLLAGGLLRKKTLMDLILRYCLLIVLFASSVFTQHLVIPMVFLAMYESRWWTWYNGIGLLYFMLHHDQLHLKVPPGGTLEDVALFLAGNGHFIMVFFLFLAFVDLHFPQLLHRKYIYRKIAGKW